MQNRNILEFANKAALLVPDGMNRRVLLPAIIGIAIGSFLTPKMGEDVQPMTAFNDAYLVNVARAVSKINEDMIIDVNAACEAAKAMYLVRHRIVNGMPLAHSVSPEFDIMAVILGFSTVLPLDVHAAFKAVGLSASTLYISALLMMDELKKTGYISL